MSLLFWVESQFIIRSQPLHGLLYKYPLTMVKLMTSYYSQRPQCPRQHVSSGQTDPSTKSLAIIQLNVEGLTTAKLDILEQLVTNNKATIMLLQETHKENNTILKLHGYKLAGQTKSRHHSLATFIRDDVPWSPAGQCAPDAMVKWTATNVQEMTIMNVYKPPPNKLQPGSLPDATAPAVYDSNFNYLNTDWGYKTTNPDGVYLADWASTADAALLLNLKEPHLFISRRWNTETNPDLAFAKVIGQEPLPVWCVLDRFPYSQHHLSLITTPSLVQSMEGKLFRGGTFATLTGQNSEQHQHHIQIPASAFCIQNQRFLCDLLHYVDQHCQETCPVGSQKELHSLLGQRVRGTPACPQRGQTNAKRARAARDLMTRLNTRQRERWTDTVESINFTHSSQQAWQTINKLTSQTTKPKPCHITADSIAVQLISNGKFLNANKEFTRKTVGEVNDLCRASSANANLSGEFTKDEMKPALKHLKPNKAARINKIRPEFILHQGGKATEWLRSFCSLCFLTSKLPKIWQWAKVITLPKPNKPLEDPKGYHPIALLCIPYKILEYLLHAHLEPVIDPNYRKSKQASTVGSPP